MLRHLDNQLLSVIVDFYGVKQIRQAVRREPDIKNCADYLSNRACVLFRHILVLPLKKQRFSI